ncbi:MAG: TolC family protein [Acidobacteriota bacterium]
MNVRLLGTHLVAGVAALLVHAGCASTGQAPERPAVAEALRTRTGAIESLPESTKWTLPPGMSLDDGLSPAEAKAIGLWNNPDFQVALTALGLARADLVEAGLIRNPVFSLLFPWGPKQLEWTVTWPVETFWQRPRKIEQAQLTARAVAERLVAHGLRLVSEISVAYIDVQASERILILAEEQSTLGRQVAGMAEARLRAGDISEFEAQLARAEAARLEVARITRTGSRDRAVARLRALLGLSPDAPPIRADPFSASPAGCGELASLIKLTLAARPDLRAAELDVEAAAARAGVERSRIATVAAILDANAEGREGFEMGPGVAVELPIFSQNDGGKARAAAELQQASRRYLAVRAALVSTVETALIQLTEARDSERVLRDQTGPALSIGRQQAERAYAAGEISLLALLETRQRLLEADLATLEASFATARARARLEEAVGMRCEGM